VAGGLAALVVHHRSWLSLHPEIEQWCLQALERWVPEPNTQHYSPASIGNTNAEAFLGEAGVALLLESDAHWVRRLTFQGVTGYYYSSPLHTMWRAYLLRERLGPKFDELINLVMWWSALRRASHRASGYYADPTGLSKYQHALFERYRNGRLQGGLTPISRAATLGHRLVERIVRRSSEGAARRARREYEKLYGARNNDDELDREMLDLDFDVIRNGFGFIAAVCRNAGATADEKLQWLVRELFDIEISSLPMPRDIRSEIKGTPYEFDIWIIERISEYTACAVSPEHARTFYRPLLDRGASAKYWVDDFLQTFFSTGLDRSLNLDTFARIWEEMTEYAMSLEVWQPSASNYWSPAESLAADLMGLRERASQVLGQAKFRDLLKRMAPAYERWGSVWLKYASVAAWFARFLTMESGQVLLAQGIRQLAPSIGTFRNDDWHRYSLGALFTEALAAAWKHLPSEIEKEPALRLAFVDILTELMARQIPEALHLRNRLTAVVGAPSISAK
jgi:hypothetical protein